jgi:uncharacterized protein
MHSSNPFMTGAKLQNSRNFIGREEEFIALISRMSGVQPISVNIVGEKRIGKSSLLYYFFLNWRQRIQNTDKYVVIYLSLKSVQCQSENNFYQVIAQELEKNLSSNQEALIQAFDKSSLDRLAFFYVIKQFKQHNILPVLCLDDFDSLFKYPEEFNNGFYDSLRALMDDNALMLIVASHKRLDVHAHEYRLVSSFFNLGHVIKLSIFTEEEAIKLTRLPEIDGTNEKPALKQQEQKYALQWGKYHPYLLQLACYHLWDARNQKKNIQWAKKKFNQETSKLKIKNKIPRKYYLKSLLILIFFAILIFLILTITGIINWHFVWNWLNVLGALPGNIGNILERFTHTITGLIILILPILIITRVLRLEDLKEILQKLIGK